MKKFILLLGAALCMMTACNKEENNNVPDSHDTTPTEIPVTEGTFNPEMKLSEVYSEISSDETGEWVSEGRFKIEEYHWNGNLLSSVTYYQYGEMLATETFNYDDRNRISGSTISYSDMPEGAYSEYSYVGEMLSSISVHENNQLVESYTFTHTDGNITKLDIKLYEIDYAFAKLRGHLNPLRGILPRQTADAINNAINMNARNAKSAPYMEYTVNFIWDGNNITNMNLNIEEDAVSINYTYDNMQNPYYCFFGGLNMAFGLEMGFNMLAQNNPTIMNSTTTVEGVSFQSTATFSYLYNGKWPTKSTREAPITIYEFDYNTGEIVPSEDSYNERMVTEYIYCGQ